MTSAPVIQIDVPPDAAMPGVCEAAQPDAMLALCRTHLVDAPPEERDAWTHCTAMEAVYQPGRACRIAYGLHDERGERPSIVYARWPAEGDTHASATRIQAQGGAFDLFRYPRDRRLRQIRDMRREEWLKEASAAWSSKRWGSGRWSDADWRCTPIKYVPESRLVCRMKGLWQIEGGGEKWVRAYIRISRIDNSADQVDTLNAVKEALFRAGTPFDIPLPLASMHEQHLLATDFFRGTTLREQADGENQEAVLDACRRIAGLSQLSELWPLRSRPVPSPLPQAMLSDLAAGAPALAMRVHTLNDWAHTLPAPPDELRPIHGDLHSGQIIHKGSQLFLVDWDRAALGDPTADICNLASELEFRQHLAGFGRTQTVVSDMTEAWRGANGAYNSAAAPWWFAYACVLRAWGLLRHLRPQWSDNAAWLLDRAAGVLRERSLDVAR